MGGGDVNPYVLKARRVDTGAVARSAIDLFSGAGGVTLGLLNAGFDVLLCSDISESCEATHRSNFPEIPFIRRDIHWLAGADIRREAGIGNGELDLLIGGPPCQGFSIIGQRQLWDPRNGLFREFMRIAGELEPKTIVIENVTGLATLERGAVLAELGGGVPRCRVLDRLCGAVGGAIWCPANALADVFCRLAERPWAARGIPATDAREPRNW
jgi:DNA (cytosine-5)-methyltransferase 1